MLAFFSLKWADDVFPTQKSKICSFRRIWVYLSKTSPTPLKTTPATALPLKLWEKNSCLRCMQESGRLIGGRVTLTVPTVTRVIHHVISQVREARHLHPPARDASQQAGTLNPCQPQSPLRSTQPLSCRRCLQNDSKSIRAHNLPS